MSTKASKIDIKSIKELTTKNLQEDKQNILYNLESTKNDLFNKME